MSIEHASNIYIPMYIYIYIYYVCICIHALHKFMNLDDTSGKTVPLLAVIRRSVQCEHQILAAKELFKSSATQRVSGPMTGWKCCSYVAGKADNKLYDNIY